MSARLKLVRKLSMKKYREESGLFIAEGLRLCEMALNCAEIEFGFYSENFLQTARQVELIAKLEKVTRLEKISESEFAKISDTETPQGILLAIRQRLSTPQEVVAKNLIIVLDGVRDPGNVGTILRTAEAFGCGIILLDGAADIFNAKAVRASMGAIFTITAAKMSRENFLALMTENNFEITAAVLDDAAEKYFCHDFTKKSAIVFGNEAEGVSAEIFNAAKKIFIPMSGAAESLNVATAAAVIISEAIRQNS
ncbi:MAG: RNA methyltransferase [Selenomonadaceae bacterium]|nr:RNA methyltransferase [Selenomonadaceae bacterium]